MELLDLYKNRIEFGDEKETLSFVNLGGNNGKNWKLYKYSLLFNNNPIINLTVDSVLNDEGNYSRLSFGFANNDLVKRNIEFRNDGTVLRDSIRFTNPFDNGDVSEYGAIVMHGISLDDYLAEYSNDESRVFRNKFGDIFRNNILSDRIIANFIDKGNYYSDKLNSWNGALVEIFDALDSFEYEKGQEIQDQKTLSFKRQIK